MKHAKSYKCTSSCVKPKPPCTKSCYFLQFSNGSNSLKSKCGTTTWRVGQGMAAEIGKCNKCVGASQLVCCTSKPCLLKVSTCYSGCEPVKAMVSLRVERCGTQKDFGTTQITQEETCYELDLSSLTCLKPKDLISIVVTVKCGSICALAACLKLQEFDPCEKKELFSFKTQSCENNPFVDPLSPSAPFGLKAFSENFVYSGTTKSKCKSKKCGSSCIEFESANTITTPMDQGALLQLGNLHPSPSYVVGTNNDPQFFTVGNQEKITFDFDVSSEQKPGDEEAEFYSTSDDDFRLGASYLYIGSKAGLGLGVLITNDTVLVVQNSTGDAQTPDGLVQTRPYASVTKIANYSKGTDLHVRLIFDRKNLTASVMVNYVEKIKLPFNSLLPHLDVLWALESGGVQWQPYDFSGTDSWYVCFTPFVRLLQSRTLGQPCDGEALVGPFELYQDVVNYKVDAASVVPGTPGNLAYGRKLRFKLCSLLVYSSTSC